MEVCVGGWFRDAGLEVDLVLEVGLLGLDVGGRDAWICAGVFLVVVLFSEFFLDLLVVGVVGLEMVLVR